MTQLRIAGLPVGDSKPTYRGVDRPPPPPLAPDQRDARVRHAFGWYVQNVRQDGSVDDLPRALDLVDAYAAIQPPIPLQVLETTRATEASREEGTTLGYDLAAGSYSLLSWGLELGREPRLPLAAADAYHSLLPLLRAVGDHYRGFLNSAVLFQDVDMAEECLEVLMAAQAIRPELWSHSSDHFEVVRVVALANPTL